MRSHSYRQIIQYRFDDFMARGGRSVFISLAVVIVLLLTTISVMRGTAYYVMPPEESQNERHFLRNVYVTFLEMTDPGNMNQDIQSSPSVKVYAILAGIVGLVMLSSLIGFTTTALDQKLSELKKGHSKVIEHGHTLILGWNQRVLEILRELIIANESEEHPCVVILADEDKEFMDDFMKLHLKDTENTKVVTRSGSPSSLANLEIVSVDDCKSVIVLGECNQSATDQEKLASDTAVIKTVLAIVAARSEGQESNIVAEVFDPANRRVVEQIAPGEVSTVDTNEILAKILVQTSRSVGLSVVYSEMLSFDGCELYFHHAEWGGVNFGELAFRWPDGVPLGLRHGDGTIAINPPCDTKLSADDDILILAEDDSTIDFQSKPVATPRNFTLAGGRQVQGVERELIIGWTPKVEIILREYADYVLKGSQIDVMLRVPETDVCDRIKAINEELDGVEIRLVEGDPLTTEGLLQVRPFEYDNIVILSQGAEEADHDRTDSATIVILLLLRSIFDEECAHDTKTKLITEILNSENQSLVARTGVQDFIISNRFVSMILAQISEDADVKRVYDDLFQEDGSEIYLKPASLYMQEFPAQVSYADLMGLAQQREEVCLGVKLKQLERDADQNFGVKLIPAKNKVYTLHEDDCLVVLAEDEL